MEYLVKTAGELFIPITQCSSGSKHYSDYWTTSDIEIVVNPKRPLLRYLKRLISKLKYELIDSDPEDRTNLLYKEGANELNLDINDLLSETFDFFVHDNGYGKTVRFNYEHKIISLDKKELGKQVKVRDVFGNCDGLELTHIGSPCARFVDINDWNIVDDWDMKETEKYRAEIMKELGKYLKNTPELANKSIITLGTLLCMAASDEPLCSDDVVEYLGGQPYACRCFFEEENDSNEVDSIIKNLYDTGIIALQDNSKYADNYYSISDDYRKQPGGNAVRPSGPV